MLLSPLRELIDAQLLPNLESFVSESQARTDDATDVISSVFGRIRVAFAARFSKTVTELELGRSADQVAAAGQDVHRRQLRTVLGVDPIQAEPWIERETNAFVAENASLITTLPTEAIADVEQLVFREGRRGASVAEIRRKIRDVFDATENRARLIARDQVSKFHGKLTELRQRQTGVTRYRWQTAEDGRVRSRSNTGGQSDHARLNGQIFSWDDPPVTVFRGKRAGERNHPGEDIQCRCQAIPVLDDLIPGI